MSAKGRIVLTGTPIENNLRDLWSIFDFVNPGLLGSPKAFANFVKALASQPHVSYAPLRRLVQPYILRRLKSDKSIIADLPDKTEIKAFCHLTRKQAALYQAAVAGLEERLKRLRPATGSRDGDWCCPFLCASNRFAITLRNGYATAPMTKKTSGKFARLREIAKTIGSRQEKLLVFTQFKEIIPPVEKLLGAAFGRPGLVLHGETPVARRKELVKESFRLLVQLRIAWFSPAVFYATSSSGQILQFCRLCAEEQAALCAEHGQSLLGGPWGRLPRLVPDR